MGKFQHATFATFLLSEVQKLMLVGCQHITNIGVAHIRYMRSLMYLDISATSIGDFGLALLADLPLLERLVFEAGPNSK